MLTAEFLSVFSGVFASGGRDGVIEVWDMRVTKQISHEIRPKSVGTGEWRPELVSGHYATLSRQTALCGDCIEPYAAISFISPTLALHIYCRLDPEI